MFAYGLSVPALGPVDPIDHAEPWPELQLVRETRQAPTRGGHEIGDDFATLRVPDQLTLEVRRTPLSAVVASPSPVPDSLVAHPLLAWVAAVTAAWDARPAFHAGAVDLGGRAWVLLGAPGSGKSTLVAQLHHRGVPVLSDDLAILAEGYVLAGPRTGDLRDESAARLGVGTFVSADLGRARWRVSFSDSSLRVPLGGFVELGWGPEVELRPVRPADRIAMLLRHDALALAAVESGAHLKLLGTPSWTLTRPADWTSADQAVSALLSLG